MKHLASMLVLVCLLSCNQTAQKNTSNTIKKEANVTQNAFASLDKLFAENSNYIAKGFDFPVGKPNAKGYYNAQKFTVNDHLGDDWNGTGGGNTDLGDPVYAIGNGYVKFAENVGGGWGNVIRIVHQYKGKYYESLYAHCEKISVKKGNFVKKGANIGTIGNAAGAYYAHLHFEIREDVFMELGGGYSTDTNGFLNPTTFIKSNRK
jgi:murein DD-endopeptidase MepM/ murein hydrolase activator NlpD